jgi:hypothetical protein
MLFSSAGAARSETVFSSVGSFASNIRVTEFFSDGLGRNLVAIKGFGVDGVSVVEQVCMPAPAR